MKAIKLLGLIIGTIVIFTNINAMEEVELNKITHANTKKIEFNKFFKPNQDDSMRQHNRRHLVESNLLLDFQNDLKREYIEDLKAIRQYHNNVYDFGDKELNYSSLVNWIIYTRSMLALYKLGSEEDGLKLLEEYDRAKRRLETIDFYSGGKDYKYCLSGIWCIVASFDEDERANLLKALEQGEDVPKDENLISFFKSFQYQ